MERDTPEVTSVLPQLEHGGSQTAEELVKLRYFAGLTLEESAAALDLSERTAKRDWAYARAWLYREIGRRRG